MQRLYKAAQGFALGRPLCQVSRPTSRRWFPPRHKAPVPPVIFLSFSFLRFLRLFAAILCFTFAPLRHARNASRSDAGGYLREDFPWLRLGRCVLLRLSHFFKILRSRASRSEPQPANSVRSALTMGAPEHQTLPAPNARHALYPASPEHDRIRSQR